MKFETVVIDPDLADLIPGYVSNTLLDCDEIKKHHESQDIPGIRKYCHRILGTALSYGFVQLNDIVHEIQTAAINGDMNALKIHTEKLEQYKTYLSQYIQKT